MLKQYFNCLHRIKTKFRLAFNWKVSELNIRIFQCLRVFIGFHEKVNIYFYSCSPARSNKTATFSWKLLNKIKNTPKRLKSNLKHWRYDSQFTFNPLSSDFVLQDEKD